MTTHTIRKKVAAVVAAFTTTVGLAACQPGDIAKQVTGESHCRPGPTVAVLTDISPSTLVQRAADGPYEQAVMKAATYAAEKCGTLFASAADGDAIATGRWTIDGDTFDAAVGLDGRVGAAARGRNAQKLKPLVRKLLTTKPNGYMDLPRFGGVRLLLS